MALGGFVQKSTRDLGYFVEFDPSLPEFLVSDRTRLRQVLGNLMDNAVRFTQSGSVILRIRPGLIDGAAAISFEVEDTGVGIANPDHDVIFEQFRQVDGGIKREVGGSGLGLAISKRFVNLLNGEITVSSKLGKGTTFRVVLGLDQIIEERKTAA